MIKFASISPVLVTHLSATPPAILWHYTSAEALIGIASNKELWATNSLFLNDATEAKHALNNLRHAIDSREERGDFSAHDLDFINRFRLLLYDVPVVSYTVSFTELSDSLSQWRAYCPPSGGYAVGISSAQLQNVAESQGFLLVKCLYDYQLQHLVVNEILDRFLGVYRASFTKPLHQNGLEPFLQSCYNHISQIASIFKHPSFSEEQEWRLISSEPNLREYNISFRGSNKGIIPFYKFKLTNSEHADLVSTGDTQFRVSIGPSIDNLNRQIATRIMLDHHLIGAAHMTTQIPYKTW